MKTIFTLLFSLILFPTLAQEFTAKQWLDSGYADYSNGKYEAAIDKFQASIDLDDTNPEVFYLKGVCLSQISLNIAAIKSYEKALELDPDYAEVHFEKGYSLFSLNRYQQAIESFDKAITLRPNYAEAWFNRGSVHCIVGNKEEAVRDWKRAAELGAALPDLECE